jgi:DNA-directed RNA polymerase beta' subunit
MTQLLRELQNVNYLENIDKIQFSLFSHEDINKGSVADILTFDTYEGNMPKNNGLFDHNMGSIDAAIICPIDEKKAELCPGYFGKIDLALPVFNYHFMSIIEKTLKCVCFHCSKLLIDKNDPLLLNELNNKKGLGRFKAVYEICNKNKKCLFNGGCQALQPTKYIRKNKENNNIVKIYAEFAQTTFKDTEKATNLQNFTPLVVYQIFKKIKNEDVDFLGLSSKYSRPEWMIINSLAIPPPAVRPSIRQSDNQRSEDDLTYGLAMIVKANKMLKNAIENNPTNKKNIDNFQGLLQYHVSTYMDNEIPGVGQQTQRSTYRPLKAITQRLKGKEGRLRTNIMGKRVDYSGRTVISVDPNLDIDQFGVPEKIAMNLTFPEIVNVFNIDKLKKMILNGPNKYPGAKTVTKGRFGNQRNISLKHVDVVKIANELEVGDSVHRHLIDGDPCLFNRQPTLHKMSMMTHKIVILPHSTFRLNVTVCQPYNADFDGDEMNMHIPQSLQTQTELERISLVQENLISPGNSKPSIEIVQDSVIGSYLLTIKDNKMTESQMYNYMMFNKKFNGKLPESEFKENGINYWSGKQLFSLILPDINVTQIKDVKIIRGQIEDGHLSEKSLGKDQGGIIKQIFNVYGTGECVNFLNNAQKLITRWMLDHSFSISFGDSIINKEERDKSIELINKYYNEIDELLRLAHHGTYATELDDSMKHLKMEGDINDKLSKINKDVQKSIMKNISKENGFYVSGDWGGAGSKGNSSNMLQIMGCVGQQMIWGSRIHNGFTGRTLPHFHKNDIGASAKGFCRNSYIQGLNPSEMFFHAMGGRTGSIDTAIQTAESGYISRKLIKAAEDVMVNYDFSVRNANGNILQFAYGDDNMDPTKLEHIGKIELYELNNEELEKKYKFEIVDERSYYENFMLPDAIDRMMETNEYISILNYEYEEMVDYREQLRTVFFKNVEVIGDIHTHMPINLYRVISSQLIKFNINKYDLSDLTPNYIVSEYNKIMDEIVQYLPEKEENWKLFKIIFKSFISCKRILSEYRMSKMAFDDLILLIKEKMISALITPGEMVGIIGAQTLGEISTQLTLNSVTYETNIIVRDENKNIKKIQIGDFITKNINESNKQNYNKEKDTTYAECLNYYEIPSCDINGNTVWNRIEAVTQHPVINEDGTNTMLKIKTEDGHEVIATKAKSFLQLINGKIQESAGSNLKVGDYLPVSLKNINVDFDLNQNELIEYKVNDNKYNIIPNIIDNKINFEERNNRFKDIYFCKIISIEEVSNTTNYAYDLTVENTRNFNIYNGLCMRDTFHNAGVGAASVVITEGVPRLKEILRLSKNLKSKNMNIFLKDKYSYDKEEAKKVQTKFAFTQIKDVLESSEILYAGKTGNTSNQEDLEFIQSYKEFSELFDIDNISEQIESPWILRLKFDKESLMNKNLSIQEIQEAIKEKSFKTDEIECIYSDDSAQDVIMRIRIKQESTEDFLSRMKEFEKQLTEFPLRGISNINRAELFEGNIIKYNLDGSIKASKEWKIGTEGSNLTEILTNNCVDFTRTYTNDILEFYEIFGIEATRELIFRELSKVFSGKKPNIRHIQMLSDVMTYRGILMQIERHGLNKNPEVGPLSKASFEEVMNIITNAAVFGEKDNMKGVSANIFAGQFCKNGTNSFEIIVDEEKLMQNMDDGEYLLENVNVKPENIDNMMNELYNNKEDYVNINETDFNFGFGIESKKEFMLGSGGEFKLSIDDKNEDLDKIEEENIDNIELDEVVDIDELELEDIDTENIQSEEVEINEVEKPKKGRKAKK